MIFTCVCLQSLGRRVMAADSVQLSPGTSRTIDADAMGLPKINERIMEAICAVLIFHMPDILDVGRALSEAVRDCLTYLQSGAP